MIVALLLQDLANAGTGYYDQIDILFFSKPKYPVWAKNGPLEIDDVGEELGRMETEVKIAFPLSHTALMSVDRNTTILVLINI